MVAVSSGLRCAGITEGVPLTGTKFCESVERLARAKANGCPWDERTCARAAKGGHLEVLKWAREHDCPWNEWTCARAAFSAPLEVLQWAMEHGAPIYPSQAQWYEHLLRGEPHAMDSQRR